MMSARLPLVALSTCATPSIPASVELPEQIAGGVGELGEDEDLLAVQFLRLEQPDELLELVVVLRLELLGLFEKLHDLVEVEEGLLHHLDDFVFVAARACSTDVEHLLRDDVFILRLRRRPLPRTRAGGAPRSRAPPRSGASSAQGVSSRRRSRCGPPGTRAAFCISRSQEARTRRRNSRSASGTRADQADDLLLPVLLEGDRCSCRLPCSRRGGSTSGE